jgi:hypothetical protein
VVEQEGGRRRGRVYHRKKLLGHRRRMNSLLYRTKNILFLYSLTKTEVIVPGYEIIHSNDIQNE